MKNRYEIRGDVTVIFVRRKGVVFEAIIDTEDLEKVSTFPNSWYISGGKRGYFFVAGTLRQNKHKKGILFHRFILGDVPSDKVVDHINHNTLDNRKCNLRAVTLSANAQNRKGSDQNSQTGIRGVTRKGLGWQVNVTIQGKRYTKGFDSEEAAASFAKHLRSKIMPYSKEFKGVIEDVVIEKKINCRNKSGYPGVYWEAAKSKWRASLILSKKRHHVGFFDDPQKAYEKLIEKKQKILAVNN